jgi:hypothetical protein
MRCGGLAAAALVLLLAACESGSDDPTPKEPTSASPTTPTPTATLPTMPAQASEDSSEGAAAFVKHYVDVFNYAAATGDVDELSRLSSPNCDGCQRYIDLYRDTYAAGGYFKGGDWKIGALKLETGGPESYASTDVHLDPTRYRSDSDASETTGPPENSQVTFAVVGAGKKKTMSQLVLGSV